MNWTLLTLLLVIAGFFFLRWYDNKTYRPTKAQILQILQSTLNDTIDLNTYDEFICLQITYNKKLDTIRERYNAIVDNADYVDREHSGDPKIVVPLNAIGKAKIQELINQLNAVIT